MSWNNRFDLTREGGLTKDGEHLIKTGKAIYKTSENTGTEWIELPFTVISEDCKGEQETIKWFHQSEKAKKFLYRDMKAVDVALLNIEQEAVAIETFRELISEKVLKINQWTSEQGKPFILIKQ
jgi:hypothetical protein